MKVSCHFFVISSEIFLQFRVCIYFFKYISYSYIS